MIKLVANVSKKVPVAGVEYSSQSFMAGVELEVSDGATREQIQERIRDVYATLEKTIDGEIRARNGGGAEDAERQTAHEPANRLPPANGGNGRGNGNGRHATQAQIKAILAIGRSLGVNRSQLIERVEEEFNVKKLDDLSIGDASSLIERMKEKQAAQA